MRAYPVAAVLIFMSSAANGGESGLASYYDGVGGGKTCAHRSLPFGAMVTVNYAGKSVQCRVNDRGPFMAGRIIDVSIEVARILGMIGAGIVRVTLD